MQKNKSLYKKFPVITVTIATYNSRRTIEKCLLSLKKQTYPNIDIVVVDSLFYDKNEQKKCKKIIEKYARYFQDGPERSIQRNRGITEGKGEYILILDQDMYLSKTVVEDCYNTLVKEKYIALTIPEISIGDGYWTQCVALDRYVRTYLEYGLNECCRFFRKSDAVKIHGYDPTIVGVEDSDFHYRIAEKGKIGKIKSIIYHDEGTTSFTARVKKKYYYSIAFKEYLKRRPKIAISQFSPFQTAYIKHWRILLQNPLVTLGMFTLRSVEVSAGVIGMIRK
jgi:glycosyltransferase involved in cell wall biosynthesis